MNGNDQFLGVVQDGAFELLSPYHAPGGSARLTAISMQESVPPEMAELDLSVYEGKAIMVRGHDGGGVTASRPLDPSRMLLIHPRFEGQHPQVRSPKQRSLCGDGSLLESDRLRTAGPVGVVCGASAGWRAGAPAPGAAER
jgi:hypothetical protein